MSAVRLQRLAPAPGTVTAAEAAATVVPDPDALGGDRPRVLVNMVATADGRATLGGRAGAIGNQADRELFHALRGRVDAVMAGAGTVRIEHYGRLVRDPELRARREQDGLAPDPLAVICSARLDLPPDDVPLLRDPDSTVVVLTTRTSPAAGPLGAGDGGARVELVRVGESAVDLRAGLRALRAQHGVRTLLCEGGPRLNAALLGAGLVDELFFSVAPTLAGGRSPLTIVDGEPAFAPVGMELAWVLEAESHLFLRYTIPGASG